MFAVQMYRYIGVACCILMGTRLLIDCFRDPEIRNDAVTKWVVVLMGVPCFYMNSFGFLVLRYPDALWQQILVWALLPCLLVITGRVVLLGFINGLRFLSPKH
jgi:hypothetical protein